MKDFYEGGILSLVRVRGAANLITICMYKLRV